MSKKRKRHTNTVHVPAVDLGPDVRRHRGDVVVEFRPDPDNPARGTVQGATVAVWYHTQWAQGRLTDAQHEAADRYSLWSEEADALAEGKPFAMRGGGGSYSGPGDRLLLLRARLREADEALAADREAVRWAVCWNFPPKTADDTKRILDGLQRLADFWGM